MPHLPSRKIVACLLLLLIWNTQVIKAQQSTDPKELEKAFNNSLNNLGVSMGKFGYTLVKNNSAVSEPLTNDDLQAMEKLVKGYKSGVEAGRGTIGLLDANLDVALAGTDYYTAGASLVATIGVRYAKSKGMNYLMDKIEEDQRKYLAANLEKFKMSKGLTYESLRKKSPEEIKQALNRIDAFRAMKDKHGDDPKVKALFENAMVDTIKNVSKAELDLIAKNKENIANLENRITKIDKKLSSYIDQTNSTLGQLSEQLGQTQVAIDQTNVRIDQLRNDTTRNTEQLQALTDVAFGNASAHDRLILLNGGYLRDVLTGKDLEILKDSVEAQAKKEELVAQMNSLVNDFNKIGQIASNLGFESTELNEAIKFANTATQVVNNLMQGDYLGAIVGVTGLFGPPRPDPDAQRHAQLMTFLKDNFAEINGKLDRIIEGQQKIMEGLTKLAEQAAEYDKALHEHLDRIEFKVETVQNMVRELLYRPLGTCGETRRQIIRELKDDDTTRIQSVLALPPAITRDIPSCAKFLRDIFYLSFDPDNIGAEPLSIRYSKNPPDSRFIISTENRNKYFDDPEVKKFLDKYKLVHSFFVSQSKNYRLTPHAALAGLALPVRNVGSLERKLAQLASDPVACAKGTVLSDPLLALLCSVDRKAAPSRLSLPDTSFPTLETTADLRSVKLLQNALAHDDTATLTDWALFYAPLYDIYDFQKNETPASEKELKEVLARPNYKPAGKMLLDGALEVETIALAQMNMLYGDVTAKIVFDLLWDQAGKRFLPVPVPSGEQAFETLSSQQQALAIFKSNPYIQRNVLMLGLNETSILKGPGQESAYQAALDLMKSDVADAEGLLRASFGDQWTFKTVQNIPAVSLYGVDVTLPSLETFAGREFSYPQALKTMLAKRDLLATRIADYEVIEWSVINSPNPEQTREALTRALVKLTN